jgi:outer membrane protein TolC
MVGVLLITSSPAHGQSKQRPDVLDAIVAEALRRNSTLAQDRFREARARASVREARGRYLPSLSLESRYSEQNGTVDLGEFVNPMNATLNQLVGEARFATDLSITLPYRHESRARLVQPLFNERIRAEYDAAQHGYESRRAQSAVTARAIAAETQTAFLNVAAARGLRGIWEATLELVREGERVAQRLVDAGSATPDAVFRARSERSDVEQKLLESTEQVAAASRAFNRLLDRPLDEPVDSIDDSAVLFELTLMEDEVVRLALEHRSELDALRENIRASEARVRAARASSLPEMAFALDYGFQGKDLAFNGEQAFWAASLIVSWNLYDGGQDGARRSAAQADARRASLQLEETEALIRLEVLHAYNAAVVARAAIATARDRLTAARRSFVLVRRRYEEGLASQVEFLDARTALTRAELNRVVTVYRYAIRWIELERAAALLDMATLEDPS